MCVREGVVSGLVNLVRIQYVHYVSCCGTYNTSPTCEYIQLSTSIIIIIIIIIMWPVHAGPIGEGLHNMPH